MRLHHHWGTTEHKETFMRHVQAMPEIPKNPTRGDLGGAYELSISEVYPPPPQSLEALSMLGQAQARDAKPEESASNAADMQMCGTDDESFSANVSCTRAETQKAESQSDGQTESDEADRVGDEANRLSQNASFSA